MRSSSLALVLFLLPGTAHAAPEGFAAERFTPVAPGGGWIANDELTMHGGLGGGVSLTTSYARGSLRAGTDYVEHYALVDAGFAATFELLRLSIDFASPLVVEGRSGGPSINPGTAPDVLSDTRIALAARLVGDWDSPNRFGVQTEVFVPAGERTAFVTDDRYRAIFRGIVAGEGSGYVYSASVGFHLRSLKDRTMEQGPRGSELLVNAAFGPKFTIAKNTAFVIGPEVMGATAFSEFMRHDSSALEALLTARFETIDKWEPMRRIKLGGGGGLHPYFGAPEWRAVVGIELTGNH